MNRRKLIKIATKGLMLMISASMLCSLAAVKKYLNTNAPIYATASQQEKIGDIQKGDEINVLSTKKDYVKIKLKNGKIGYIKSSALEGESSKISNDQESAQNDEKPEIKKQKKTKNVDQDAQLKTMLKQMNAERLKVGASPLKLDAKLNKAAKTRANELKEDYSHTRPNGDMFWSALEEVGYEYAPSAENINMTKNADQQEALDSWMKSSGHKLNILNKEYKNVGIAFTQDAEAAFPYLWVQIFN